MSRSTPRRPLNRLATALAGAALAVATGGLALTVPGVANALSGAATVNPPQNPTSTEQIQNIDKVRIAIKQYYGDTLDPTAVNPVSGANDLHTFDPAGAYAAEAKSRVSAVSSYVTSRLPSPGTGGHAKVLLLDVDDTSLSTYNYEIYSNFAYNPTSNAAFVNGQAFPAVPGMVDLAKYAQRNGVQVIWLTGRPEAQREATAGNLGKVGFTAPDADHLFLKDQTKPWLASCQPTCTTIQYKSLTRKHIQDDLGYRIIADVGDQQSDLTGGFADKTFKMPNPMYYLP